MGRRLSVSDGIGAMIAGSVQLGALAGVPLPVPDRIENSARAGRMFFTSPTSLEKRAVPIAGYSATGTVTATGGKLACRSEFIRSMLEVLEHKLSQLSNEERQQLGIPRDFVVHEHFRAGTATDITFSVSKQELAQKHARLRAATTPKEVQIFASKRDKTLVPLEAESDDDGSDDEGGGESVAISALYDVLEKRRSAFGEGAVVGDVEAGATPLYDELGHTPFVISSELDPGLATVLTKLLNHDICHDLRVGYTSAQLLSLERTKSLPWKGPLVSVGLDLLINLPYEMAGLPALKRRIGWDKPVQKLTIGQKVGSSFLDELPAPIIETGDTYAALLTASETARKKFKKGDAFVKSVISGQISFGTAVIAAGMRYWAPESEDAQRLAFFLTVVAGVGQLLGAIAGFLIEPRDQQAQKKATQVQAYRDKIFAPPAADAPIEKLVDQRAKREMEASPDTNLMFQTITDGIIFQLIFSALGPGAAEVVPPAASVPVDLAVNQPFEAIGGVAIALAARVGVPMCTRWLSTEKQKAELRMTEVNMREAGEADPANRPMSKLDNIMIDKEFLAVLGRLVVALAAKPVQGLISAMDKARIKDDNRTISRLPTELIEFADTDLTQTTADSQLRRFMGFDVDKLTNLLMRAVKPEQRGEDIDDWHRDLDAAELGLGDPRGAGQALPMRTMAPAGTTE